MKIGINASFLRKPATGIGQVTTHFLNELIKQIRENKKHKNHKFVLYLEEDIELDLPKNFQKKVFLPAYKRDDLFRKIWWEKFSLPCQAHKDGCDILFSLYQSATVIKYVCMKHIVLVHDIIPKIFPEYLNNFRKKIYQSQIEKGIYGAHVILTVSKYTKKDLIEKMNVNPAKIITNYISVDPLYSKEIVQSESERVMKKYNLKSDYIYSGGGLEVRKNTDGTLRAYKKLVDRNSNVPTLVISGKLMPQLVPLVIDVEKIVKELELEDKVKIIGYIEQRDLPALYKNALMFVYPSHYEGFGMPVLEAMQIGAPTITADNSSLPEVGGEAVLYSDDESDEDLVSKMEELLENEELRNDLVIKAKKKSEEFSWEKFVDGFFEIVDKN
ncbi:MAG: glycosyltransferase family 4 protein [Candidatus Moranbacteria bacterium]|nr:glycosyltransferase family 4 protein [Candidatus Moranbacteria bacterium]